MMPLTVRPEKNNTCAVVITYQPDDGLPGRIAHICDVTDRVVIVDNQSTGTAFETLGEVLKNPGIKLIRNDRNLGIAAALNQGIREAWANGYRWVITFDQDTIVRQNLLRELQSVYDCIPDKRQIAIIGCNYWDPIREQTLVPVSWSGSWIERRSVTTSGSLMSLAAFDIIGPFLCDLFIDHVDDEYCLRARSKGFKIVLAMQPHMEHSLGPGRTHATIWGAISTSDYPPVRWYYMTRNHFILTRRYLFKEPRWIIAGLVYRVIMFSKMLWLEKNRIAKARQAALGLIDGLCSGARIRVKSTFTGRIAPC